MGYQETSSSDAMRPVLPPASSNIITDAANEYERKKNVKRLKLHTNYLKRFKYEKLKKWQLEQAAKKERKKGLERERREDGDHRVILQCVHCAAEQ